MGRAEARLKVQVLAPHHTHGWGRARFSRKHRKQFVTVRNTEAMMLRQDFTVAIGHLLIIPELGPAEKHCGVFFRVDKLSNPCRRIADAASRSDGGQRRAARRVGSFVLPCRGVQDEGLYSRHCTPDIAYGLRHFP